VIRKTNFIMRLQHKKSI